MSCNKVREKLKRKQKTQQVRNRENNERLNQAYLRGPGSALKHILFERYKISPCGACHATAKKMDAEGALWCASNIDYLIEQLHNNAKSQKWTKLLDFMENRVFGNKHYKSLIREAIKLHVDEKAKLK